MVRATISRDEFRALKSGDLIVWRGKYLRTVAKGPANNPKDRHLRVEFPIRQRSWTNRVKTVYLYNDVKDKIRVAHRRGQGLMLPSEWKTLESSGFDVRKELTRELDAATDLAERMGRSPCAAYGRLSMLIRKTVGTGRRAKP